MSRRSGVVRTHNANGYRRGCRCKVCRDGEARRRREQRARKRKPCDVCRRVHPGRCAPGDQRSRPLHLTIPSSVDSRLRERVPWGERSGWVAALIERELDNLDAEELAA